MKKLISGLFAALLMTAGLVVVADASVTAAPARACGGDYPPCTKTQTHASGPKKVDKKHRAKFGVSVTASGNKRPSGTITVTIKPGNKTVTVKYDGKGKVAVTLPKLDPGKYTLIISFDPKGDFKPSQTKRTLKVTKK